MPKPKFKHLEAIVFDPGWSVEDYYQNPIKRNELVYWVGTIPNAPGHGIVMTRNGRSVPMVHPEDFRKAREDEV